MIQSKVFKSFITNSSIVIGLAAVEAADTSIQGGSFSWTLVTGAAIAAGVKFLHSTLLTIAIERSLKPSPSAPETPLAPSS